MKVKNKLFMSVIEKADMIKSLLANVEDKYKLRTVIYKQTTHVNKCLYVLISKTVKLAGINQNRLAYDLLKDIRKYDEYFLITIGDYAKRFADHYKIIPLFHFDDINMSDCDQLKSLIYEYYITNRVSNVVFYLNTNRLDNNKAVVLPAHELKINTPNTDQTHFDLDNLMIYPNLFKMVKTLEMMYLNNLIHGLMSEAAMYPLKQRLAKINQKIKDIDERIMKTKMKIIKIKSNIENEELLLLSQ